MWAEYARDHLKGKKIAVVHDKTTYGKGLADAALDNMHKFGIKEVLYEGVNTGEKDYSAIVSKIKESGADYLMWGGLHTEGGLIIRQMRDQGMKTVMISGDGITDNEFAQIGGPGVEGTLMTFGPDPRNNPAAKDVVAEFKAKSFDPEAYTLYSYAAVQIIKQAAEKAKSLDPKKVAEVMHSGMPFHTVIGDIAYDKKGDRTSRRLRLVRLEEGRRRQDHLQADVIGRRRSLLPACGEKVRAGRIHSSPCPRHLSPRSGERGTMTRRRRRVFLRNGQCPMSRLALLFGAASFVAVLGLSAAADAETGAVGKPAGQEASHASEHADPQIGARTESAASRHHNYAHDTFRQPTPIHGTMAGPRM